MPGVLYQTVVFVALALAVPFGVPGAAQAEADAATIGAIDLAVSRDAGVEVLAQLALRLAGLASAADPVAPAFPTARPDAPLPARVQIGDLQAALTQLAILSGSNGHLGLQLAQGGRKDVIYVLAGDATLADLQGDDGLLTRVGDVWHLQRPLVVWPGARLRLNPGDVLEMDPAGGAFLLNFGALSVTGASLRGGPGGNAGLAGFRPFVLVAGQGTFQATDARFDALGYGGPMAFRGVSVLTGGVMQPATPPVITGSVFRSVGAVSLEGTDGLVIRNTRFEGATALSVKGGTGLTLAYNRITGPGDRAGLRLSGVLKDVTITGNVVSGGGRNGIQVDGSVRGLTLVANVVTANRGAGVTVARGTCVVLTGNIIAQNGAGGVRLVETGGAALTGNAIIANGSAGVEVRAQAGLGPIRLSGNAIRHNREGLRAAGLGEVALRANDLALQTPRQFAGDFAPWLAAYLTDGTGALVIPAAAGTPLPAPSPCKTE